MNMHGMIERSNYKYVTIYQVHIIWLLVWGVSSGVLMY